MSKERVALQKSEDSRKDRFISDGSGMTVTQCLSCKHWVPKSWGCSAFMSSIPQAIRTNDYDHREEYDGDDGIRFEPKDDTDPKYLKNLYHVLDQVAPHHGE